MWICVLPFKFDIMRLFQWPCGGVCIDISHGKPLLQPELSRKSSFLSVAHMTRSLIKINKTTFLRTICSSIRENVQFELPKLYLLAKCYNIWSRNVSVIYLYMSPKSSRCEVALPLNCMTWVKRLGFRSTSFSQQLAGFLANFS